MEETFLRAMRMRALPTVAVIERKMFKAKKNSIMPAGGALSA